MSDPSEKEPTTPPARITGKADDVSVKGVSYTPLLTSLLKPTAEMLGKEISHFLKEKIDNWKEKRRIENVLFHLKLAKMKWASEGHGATSFINEDPPDPGRQEDMLAAWIDGVQDVKPDSGPLVDLWQELLVRIRLGLVGEDFLIKKLKQLDAEQAALLINLKDRRSIRAGSEREYYQLAAMRREGLLSFDFSKTILSPVSMLFLYILAIALVLLYWMQRMSFKKPVEPLGVISELISTTGFSVVVAIVLVLGLGAAAFSKRRHILYWRPSWIGEELLRGVRRSDLKSNPAEEKGEMSGSDDEE